MDHSTNKKPRICGVFYIGAPGFEPGTSPTRTARATRLRHAPTRFKYPTPLCSPFCLPRPAPRSAAATLAR